ncbi:catabolite repression protein crec [Zymoseptoria brevis]|uniref:Catabolite repression protein crec n=1 Tax=Zymoseptoria brevis TaxID=1047168 RepID=A0A0F4GSE8_9PEZI|nr:catabolite repression protein crec [Zymoseptoria brevis]
MFVLPPPPRYPSGNLYTGMPGGGPILETNNTLEHPTGPEYQLVLGEGVYELKDDLHIATPPPHPSDAPQPNTNPLATTIGPPVAGVKLSIAVLAPRRPPTQNLFRFYTHQSGRSRIAPSIQEEAYSPRSENGSAFNGLSYQQSSFGDGNPALLPAVPAKGKKDQKPKPKNNIVKSNSSYVSRVIPHESLPKRLSERSPEGLFAFANINRAFVWLDLSSEAKTENLTKILFTKANVLCHDVNPLTKSATHLDVVLGFNTGDIIWYEPMTQKYARLNKNGLINPSTVSTILWLPNKENLFIASHTDGTLVVYDKEKEDAEFVPEDAPIEENGHANGNGLATSRFRIKKSVQSRNQKTNPVAVWKVSSMKINSIAFSPDGHLLAVVSDDGSLKIMDYVAERVLDVFRSYYGAMLCVTWSPDGRYVLTGGQDDLVSIWSIEDRALVARCEGHSSWITDVKFDPWRCDERNYRFGSVGDDCRLLLWDFSVGMLGRPKAVRHRGSISSHVPADRKHSISTVGRLRSTSNLTQTATAATATDEPEEEVVVHALDSKASTAVLPPVMSKKIGDHPLCWLGFEEHCVLSSCKDGHIREWVRPG